MVDLPKRRRGRPTKEEAAARRAAEEQAQAKEKEENSFLEDKLAQPIQKRRSILQPDEDTIRTIAELAKLFCTQDEIAAVLGVTKRTLTNFFSANPEAHEAWEDGLQHAKISLRRKQLALADKNAPAAIFLGKNYLAQKDEVTNVNINKTAEELSEEQLMEIAARAARRKEEKDKPAKPVLN